MLFSRELAEPSPDTPVVRLSNSWTCHLKRACFELQAASALTSPHSSAGGGFSVPAGFSRDRWRRRNHLQLCRLFICLPEAFQSVIQGLTGSPVTPSWRGSLLFRPQHPLPHQLLHTRKVAEMAGLAVLTCRQQAQGKGYVEDTCKKWSQAARR